MMQRREFLRRSAAAGLFSLLPRTGLWAEATSKGQRPNVLFLFSDQHNAGVTGYSGSKNVRTPHLDQLAQQGTRFDRTYCQDGVCLPSRNSIMTSQYCRTLGLMENADWNRVKPENFARFTPLQQVFQNAGYYTFTAGKRHLQPPLDTSWNYTAGDLWQKSGTKEISDNLNYWTWVDKEGHTPQARADFSVEFGKAFGGVSQSLACALSELPPEATMEAFAAAQTIDFLKSPQAKKQPFFAWSTFYRPHQPYTPLPQYANQVDYAALELPSTIWQDPKQLPPVLAAGRKSTHPCWNLGQVNEAGYRRYIGYYSALVAEIDAHIGAILQTLQDQGLADNTIVVYCSDHGDFVGGHGMVEKFCWGHNVYEETLRVPLIFRWPGKIAAGSARQDLAELVDVYPTLLSLCGIPAPTAGLPVAGRDISATLTRGTPIGRPYAISENMFQASVITDDYKYAQWLNCPGPDNKFQQWGNMLFQRSTDPGEATNLINSTDHADQKTKLAGYLQEWAGRTDDQGRRDVFEKLKTPYAVL